MQQQVDDWEVVPFLCRVLDFRGCLPLIARWGTYPAVVKSKAVASMPYSHTLKLHRTPCHDSKDAIGFITLRASVYASFLSPALVNCCLLVGSRQVLPCELNARVMTACHEAATAHCLVMLLLYMVWPVLGAMACTATCAHATSIFATELSRTSVPFPDHSRQLDAAGQIMKVRASQLVSCWLCHRALAMCLRASAVLQPVLCSFPVGSMYQLTLLMRCHNDIDDCAASLHDWMPCLKWYATNRVQADGKGSTQRNPCGLYWPGIRHLLLEDYGTSVHNVPQARLENKASLRVDEQHDRLCKPHWQSRSCLTSHVALTHPMSALLQPILCSILIASLMYILGSCLWPPLGPTFSMISHNMMAQLVEMAQVFRASWRGAEAILYMLCFVAVSMLHKDVRRSISTYDLPLNINLQSLSGPNSRPCARSHFVGGRRSGWYMLYLILCLHILSAGGVRVPGQSMSPGGVAAVAQNTLVPASTTGTAAAKHHGFRVTGQQPLTRTAKRSFRRALNRARTKGGAWYKGKWLPGEASEPRQSHTKERVNHHPRKVEHRMPNLGLLTWNCGCLGLGDFDELLLWLDEPSQSQVVVVCVQETHWKHNNEWTKGRWLCMHSHDPNHVYAGVLTMISTKLAPSHLVKFQEHVPGRLTQTRIQLGDTNLDVFNLYQFPWNTRKPRPELLKNRAHLTASLDSALKKVSRRNLLVIMGDFNTQLAPLGRHVGTATCIKRIEAQCAEDGESLLELLVDHDLTAANTWCVPRASRHTYSLGDARTMIDFALVRVSMANLEVKKARPLVSFPVGASKLDGRHLPVMLRICAQWRSWRQAPSNRPPLDLARLQSICSVGGPELDRVREALPPMLAQSGDPQVINDQLLQIVRRHFPCRSRGLKPHHEEEAVQRPIRMLWQYWRELRTIQTCSLPGVLKAWKLFTLFRRQKKKVQRCSRSVRRERLENSLREAQSAACVGDPARLYRVVNRLGSKQPRARVQVRGKAGEILSAAGEAKELRRHFREVFSSDCVMRAAVCPVPDISLAEVQQSLCHIPARKATPGCCVPAAIWRACSDVVAPWLHEVLNQMWGGPTPEVPALWRDAWLALIPKPSKPSRKAGDLRPIGLQCALGKSAIKILCNRVRPFIQEYLDSIPQFAYLKDREATGALARVFQHFRTARESVRQNTMSIHHRYAGHAPEPFTGGIALSLDLTQAFDRLRRDILVSALQEAKVPAPYICLIVAWHQDAKYRIIHAGQELHVDAQQGVRQGCLLAPLIFACATGYLLKRLPGDHDWMKSLTVYADDFMDTCDIRSAADVRSSIARFGSLIDMLQQAGLNLSEDKSVILARVSGKSGTKFWKKLTVRKEGKLYLPVHTSQGVRLLKVVDQHRYLGAVVSYHAFESLTLKHRISSARTNYRRLQKLLHARKFLTQDQRAQMWRTCVWTSLMYALPVTGLDAQGASKLQGLVATHLRAIAQSPRHLTHETSASVLSRLKVRDPLEVLIDNSQALLLRLEALPESLSRCAKLQTRHALDSLHQRRKEKQDSSQKLLRIPYTEGLPCPHCGLYFVNQTGLDTHIGHAHSSVMQQAKMAAAAMTRAEMGTDGLPTCSQCGRTFFGWQNLQRHLAKGRCKAMHAITAGSQVQAEVSLSANLPKASAASAPAERSKQDDESRQKEKEPSLVGTLTCVAQPSKVPVLGASCGSQPVLPFVKWHNTLQQLYDTNYKSAHNNAEILAELEHRCCLCRQWSPDYRQHKQRLRKSHSELTPALDTLVTQRCSSFAKRFPIPCPFCRREVLASHRNRHATTCNALYQLVLSVEIAKREGHVGSHGRGAGSVPTSTSQCSQQGGRPTSGLRQQTHTETGRLRDGQAPQTKRRLTSKQRPPSHAASEGGGSAVAEAGGRYQYPENGQVLSSSHENVGGWHDAPHLPSDLPGMAAGKGGQATEGHIATQDRTGQGHDGGDESSHAEGLLGRGDASNSVAAQVGHRGFRETASLVLPDLQCGHKGGAAGPQSSSAGAQPGAQEDGISVCSSDARNFSALSRAQALGRDVQRGHVYNHDRDSSEGTKCHAGVSDPVGVSGLQNLQSGGQPPQIGDDEPLSPGQSHRGHAWQLLNLLRLENPHNLCYQHATILSLTWALASSCVISRMGTSLMIESGSQRLDNIITALLSLSGPTRLLQVRGWPNLLRGWRQPARQHDASEFVQHILHALRPTCMEATWQQRRGDEVRDIGTTMSPILLPVQGCVQLQHCVRQWARHDGVHALHSAPPLVCLQLNRFSGQHPQIRKNRDEILLGNVQIPVFVGHSTRVRHVLYKPVASVIHIGESPHAGHYRALLLPQVEHRELGDLFGARLTEDGTESIAITADVLLDVVNQNTYLVWCCKAD